MGLVSATTFFIYILLYDWPKEDSIGHVVRMREKWQRAERGI